MSRPRKPFINSETIVGTLFRDRRLYDVQGLELVALDVLHVLQGFFFIALLGCVHSHDKCSFAFLVPLLRVFSIWAKFRTGDVHESLSLSSMLFSGSA